MSIHKYRADSEQQFSYLTMQQNGSYTCHNGETRLDWKSEAIKLLPNIIDQ